MKVFVEVALGGRRAFVGELGDTEFDELINCRRIGVVRESMGG